NYYVAQALGLDPSGRLLSKEIFGNSVFYLDTNILFHALEPKARHHGSFKALSNACNQLQMELKVCQISLSEFQDVVKHYREIIRKVAAQIPEKTAPKIRGMFYRLYCEQLQSTGTADLDKIFDIFDNPVDDLSKLYNVARIHDGWFMEAEIQPETASFAEAIRQAYKKKRGRLKNKRSALHDALLLRWIPVEQGRTGKNTWLITLDTSLPGFVPEGENMPTRSLSITLDALLQWISPIAIHGDIEDEVAEIFAEAVKYQLLPQESFFELRDFLIFAEMEWSCKELPAEDVEEC
ncbi:unnamed protein product, partial [marine sediment metagenome]